MNQTVTIRGFSLIEFEDDYNNECSLQKSSIATRDCIWLGIDNPEVKVLVYGEGWVEYPLPEGVEIFNRMHLTQDQVRALLPYLETFVNTGELYSDYPKYMSGINVALVLGFLLVIITFLVWLLG